MRLNLITNPSFKTVTTGWTAEGSGVSIARITSDYYIGDSCLEVTKAAVSNAGVATGVIAVSPSTSYAAAVYVKIPIDQETSSLRLDVTWHTAVSGGTEISTSSSALTELIDEDGWYRLSFVASSPSTANAAIFKVIQPTSGTSGKKFLVDAAMLEAASFVNEYFDDVTQATETAVVNKAMGFVPPPAFTGMELNADIALGSLVFNTIDENNVVWVCTDVTGWWEHPEPTMPELDRGFGDGGYDVHGRYQARYITIEGAFMPPSREYVAAARDKLIRATNLVYSGAWFRTNESPTKASFVRLSGKPEIRTIDARGRTIFSIGLRAADPIKYEWVDGNADGYDYTDIPCESVSPSATGTATITNTGNVKVPVIFEITGAIGNDVVITNTTRDESINIVSSMTSGHTLEIDTYNRQVAYDGVLTGARAKLDVLIDWIYLDPGENIITFTDNVNSNSTANCRVYYKSGWLG